MHVTFHKNNYKWVRILVIARLSRMGTLFRLDATTIFNFNNVIEKIKNIFILWYCRLDHIHDIKLKTIKNNNWLDVFSCFEEKFISS